MEYNKNEVMDVSPFLLVEGSADSEADYGLLKLCLDVTIACDDDDAESCSCDTSDILDFHETNVECDDQDYGDFNDGDKNIHDHQDPSWSSCKMWLRDGAAWEFMSTEEGEEESKVGINLSNREVMDEMEDRLFWETCMAAGYP